MRQLEEMYMSKKQNATVGKMIRDKMGYASPVNQKPDFDRAMDHDTLEDGDD